MLKIAEVQARGRCRFPERARAAGRRLAEVDVAGPGRFIDPELS